MRRFALLAVLLVTTVPAQAQDLHGCAEIPTPAQIARAVSLAPQVPRIEARPAFRLTGLDGSFTTETSQFGIDGLWGKFEASDQWIRNTKDSSGIGICYGNDGAGGFHYFAGTEVVDDSPPHRPFASFEMPAQTYAVFTHRGVAWTVAQTRYAIHKSWLAAAGLTALDAPEIEAFPLGYKPSSPEAVMEIWVPVAGQ